MLKSLYFYDSDIGNLASYHTYVIEHCYRPKNIPGNAYRYYTVTMFDEDYIC